MGAIIEAFDHDMAAFDQADSLAAANVKPLVQNLSRPWPCGINQHAGARFVALTGLGRQVETPMALLAGGRVQQSVGTDGRAPLGCVKGGQYYQAAILDPAIGLDEGGGQTLA